MDLTNFLILLCSTTIINGQFLGLYSEAQVNQALENMRLENNKNMAICTSLIAEARRAAENCSQTFTNCSQTFQNCSQALTNCFQTFTNCSQALTNCSESLKVPQVRDVVYFTFEKNKPNQAVQVLYGNTTDNITAGGDFHVMGGRFNSTIALPNLNISVYDSKVKVLLPLQNRDLCKKLNDCSGFVLSPSPLKLLSEGIISEGKCYDVLKGNFHYASKSTQLLAEFTLMSLEPLTVLCDHDKIKRLLSRPVMLGYGDFFSSIEDWIAQELNLTIGGVNDLINSLSDQVTSGFASLETSMQSQMLVLTEDVSNTTAEVGEQITELADEVNSGLTTIKTQLQTQTRLLADKVSNATVQAEEELSGLKSNITKDFNKFEMGFHEFLHILEFLGTLVILFLLYKLYKKARSFYGFLNWLGLTRLWSRRTKKTHKKKVKSRKPT